MTLPFLDQEPALAFVILALSVLFSPLIAGIERIVLGCFFCSLRGDDWMNVYLNHRQAHIGFLRGVNDA